VWDPRTAGSSTGIDRSPIVESESGLEAAEMSLEDYPDVFAPMEAGIPNDAGKSESWSPEFASSWQTTIILTTTKVNP
jgi:hypothetical protein